MTSSRVESDNSTAKSIQGREMRWTVTSVPIWRACSGRSSSWTSKNTTRGLLLRSACTDETLKLDDRNLLVYVMNHYKNIWKAKNVEIFKGRCLAWSEYDFIGSGPTRAQRHLTGTFPFIPRDLLITKSLFGLPKIDLSTRPKVHLYRNDLESFFYILIWAASRFDLNAGALVLLPAGPPLLEWFDRHMAQQAKAGLHTGLGIISLSAFARPEWQGLWKEWIVPLSRLLRDGFVASGRALQDDDNSFDHATCGGLITFEKFMQTIGATLHGLNPTTAI